MAYIKGSLTIILTSYFRTVTMTTTIINALRQAGFEEKEVAIYLCLVKNIEATAFEIAKLTKIPRTSVYTALESLKARGIVSSFKKNNVSYYTPESPNKLLQTFREKEKIIESIIPEIRALADKGGVNPTVKLYTGKEGMKLVLEDILETLEKENLKEISASFDPLLLEHLPQYFPNWLKRRKDMGIYTKLIIPYEKNILDYSKSNSHRETRAMPESFPFGCCMDIYADKIAFISFKDGELYSVILESPTITAMFKQFFFFTWNMLGEKSRV